MFPLTCIRQSPPTQDLGSGRGHSGKAACIINEGIEGFVFLPLYCWMMLELDEATFVLQVLGC